MTEVISSNDYIDQLRANRPHHKDIPESWWAEREKNANCPTEPITREIYLAGSWVQKRMEQKGCFTGKQIENACSFVGMKLFFVVMNKGDIWRTTKRFIQYYCKHPRPLKEQPE